MTEAYECAVRLLIRREHGAQELCDKLEQKGYTQEAILDALDTCQRLMLQSDTRYVESVMRTRIRQGYGPLRISQELKNKGINSALIQSVLAEEKDHWLTYAVQVWNKKTKGQVAFSFIELQKQQRFLLYRGFSMDTIAMVLEEIKSFNG